MPDRRHDLSRTNLASQLADERARLRTVLESAPVGFALLDNDLHYLMVNRRLADINGVPAEAHVGRTIGEVVPDIAQQVQRVVERLRATGEPIVNGEVIGTTARFPGETRYWSESWYPVKDDRGDILGLAAIVDDITERKHAEQRLRDSELFARKLVESSLTGLYLHDVALGRDTYINPMYTRLTGYTQDDLSSMSREAFAGLFHPDDRARVAAHVAALRSAGDGETLEIEYRLRHADGRYLWCQSRNAVFDRDEQGNVRRIIGSFLDVTQRRDAEDRLQASEEQLSSMFRHSSVGMAQADPLTRRFVRVNRSLCAITGYSEAELLAMTVDELNHPEDRDRDRELYEHLARGERRYDIEKRYRRKDGNAVWVRVAGNVVRDHDGRPLRAFAVIEDITERKRAEDLLRESDRRKDEFLATLAHELRNPLAPIRTGLDLLRMLPEGDARREAVMGGMERQMGQLVRLVDDLLDLSRISTGKLKLRLQTTDLAAAVRMAVETCEPRIRSRRLRLDLALPHRALPVRGDPVRLAQIVTNILSNASKFTPEGGSIQVALVADGDTAILRVRDTGIGIPADKLGAIFAMFAQVEPQRWQPDGGLGIGLHLAKRLVELQGGEIRARSEGPGKGAEFEVRLPIEMAAAAESGPVPERQAAPIKRALVVDDNVDAAHSLAMLLTLLGHEAKEAHDGVAALEIAESQRPEVVFLDLGMPKMNGYQVARAIRARPWGGAVRLVALSGWGQEEDKRSTSAAGFDDHLTKPAEPADLERVLKRG